jgi:hypothetical protein
MRRLAVMACLLASGPCIAKDYNANFTAIEGTDQSIFVVSVRVIDKCRGSFQSHAMKYEVLANNKVRRGVLALANPLVASDFKNPDGNFYVLKQQAGDLRLADVQHSSTKGGFWSEPLDLGLKLEPGRFYYLGEMTFEIPAECDHYVLSIKDESIRDGLMFDERTKTLKSTMLEYRPLFTESIVVRPKRPK